jgi:thermostable 8-oxoguanine DNA glycosylase
MANLKSERVTIDVHMIRCLGIEGSLTNKKYRDAEKALQDYAKKINIKPYQLQAQLWCIVRGASF